MEASRHSCSSDLHLDITVLPTRRLARRRGHSRSNLRFGFDDKLDTLLPVGHFIRRARPSDAWFDKECRDAKRLTRTLQWRYSIRCRLSDSTGAALARDTWYHLRRLYRQLRHRKASDFWRLRIESERSDPKRLWRSVDRLLGRGRLAASTSVSANEYCHSFANKAFDRVHYGKLFNMLVVRDMPFVTIRLVLNMYTSHVTKVMWNGIYSSSFLVENGVKQGGIVSPILFLLIFG